MVIDSHIHFWDPSRFEYPWLNGGLDRAFVPSDLDVGGSDVTTAVFVQADVRPDQSLDEARWVAEFAPFVSGIIAHAPLEQGTSARRSLEQLALVPTVRGIRRNLQDESPELFEHAGFRFGLRALVDLALPFDACVRWFQLPHLAELVEAVPDLVVVLDHLGKPPVMAGWESGEAERWRQSIRRLSRIERVTVKLSGLAPESPPQSALEPLVRPFLDHALDAFGADRCMVGSDWPVSAVVSIQRAYADWFDVVLAGLSESERALVGADTARRVYRL